MSLDVDRTTKLIGAVTALFAMVGGGYTATDKLGLFRKPILEWSPEYFSITGGPADGEFAVVAARKKIRDDCSVEQFYLEVRDSRYKCPEGEVLINYPDHTNLTFEIGALK